MWYFISMFFVWNIGRNAPEHPDKGQWALLWFLVAMIHVSGAWELYLLYMKYWG